METLHDATLGALKLLFSGNVELWEIIAISFRVSCIAIVVATIPALMAAFALTYARFPGRRLIISINSTLLSLPAVVVGLTLYILFSRIFPVIPVWEVYEGQVLHGLRRIGRALVPTRAEPE